MSTSPLRSPLAINLIRHLMDTMRVLRKAKLSVQTDIIIRKLSHLRIVNAEHLSFFSGAKSQARDVVHDPENGGGDGESVGEACDAVGGLVAELDVVVVDPAAGDDGAVETGNGGLGKDTAQKVTNDTTDAV